MDNVKKKKKEPGRPDELLTAARASRRANAFNNRHRRRYPR